MDTLIDTSGGFALTPLKNEKGARFNRRSPSLLITQAIGRGTIVDVIK